MRILEITPYFLPFLGGVEYHSYYICKELKKLGAEITIVCSNHLKKNKNKKVTELFKGLKIKRVPVSFNLFNTPISLNFLPTLLKQRFDVIHAHIPSPFPALMGVFTKIITKKPLIITYHNDIGGIGGIAKLGAWLYNKTIGAFILSQADKIIATSPIYLKNSPWLSKWKKKTVIIPNGVDLKIFKPENSQHNKSLQIRTKHKDKKIIFFMASLGPYKRYKGVEILIQSAKIIKEKYGEDFVIIVGGEGELKKEYMQLSKKLGLEKMVSFPGFITDEDLPYYYGACDLSVLPSTSVWEGFGLVLVEAMASNKPVIGSNIGGIPYAIGKGGILAEPKNPKDLGNAVSSILNDNKLARSLATQGRKRVQEKFNWEIIGTNTINLFEQIIERKRRRKRGRK